MIHVPQEADDGQVASPKLVEALLSLVASQTSRRYVAVYPVSFKTIAVNDGAQVSVCAAGDLHDELESLLRSPDAPRWLVVDTAERTARAASVAQAYQAFRDSERNANA